jgi:hypothetical protein
LIVDFDDLHETNHRLDLLQELKDANPAFRCTVFAVPARGSDAFWNALPDWLELAVHGWLHPDPFECANWDRETMLGLMDRKPTRFVEGFKAPGWQISQPCYDALLARDWWVADQPYNDTRRPLGLRVHRLDDGEHWHGHIQNVCGNGLEETFDRLLPLVTNAETFELISEVVEPWH